MNTGVTKNY